ncbi:MAG: tyrosine-type recombinase/integrase [Chloroflexi bacterium]|nr:tyrosine-type recombinase/integrase [Chloroflexota bacterium]
MVCCKLLQSLDPQRQQTTGSPVPVSEEARRRITEALEDSLAPTTRVNYISQWRKWEMFAGDSGYPVFPSEPVHLADWITQRAADGRKPGTIRMGLAAVGSVHRQANLPNPTEDEGVRATMRGITRAAGRAQKQAAGLTAASLAAIRATACAPRIGRGGSLETTGTAQARGLVDIALISLMRDGMLRRSEAESLTWGELVEEGDGTGRLTVARSKTDPEGEGAVLFVSAPTMEALRAIRPTDASASDSLFGLSDDQIARRVTAAAEAAGLGEGFTGHSARVGMAQDLARGGTELPALMTAGRWQSPTMPARYTRAEQAGRGAVARFYGSG